jgi:hypothetical protein
VRRDAALAELAGYRTRVPAERAAQEAVTDQDGDAIGLGAAGLAAVLTGRPAIA